MKYLNKLRPLLLLCMSVLSAGVQAAPEATVLEEITVRSTRLDQSVYSVAGAVSVVDQDAIQRHRQLLGLDEALNRVPGLISQNRFNFAQDLRLAIRGFGSRANFGIRGLRLYTDGIPATTPDGQSGVDDIDLNTISRIEVLRGPSSSLYGAASGGVLNLTTEEGSGKPWVQTGAALGEFGYRRYHLKGAGESGPVNYFFSGSRLDYDGYRDNSATEATTLYGKVRYTFEDDSDLMVVMSLVDSPKAEDAGGITPADVAADRRQAQPRNLSSNADESVEQQKIGLSYRRAISDSLELRLRHHFQHRDFEAFLPIGTHIRFVADDGVVAFERRFFGGGAQLSWIGELAGMDNRLVTGFDIDVQNDDRQRFLNNAGVAGALSFDQEEQARAAGIFVRNELNLTQALQFTLGLRFDQVDLEVNDRFLGNADQSGSLDFSQFSPTVGLLWALRDNFSVYANYASSFETPTFTELASPARNLSVSLGGFNSVDAQQARSFEVGSKGSFLDGRLYIDAALFFMQVDDEISSVSNVGNRTEFENADTQRTGAELYVQAQLLEGLQLSAAYTWSDFEFDRFATAPTVEDNRLPGLPEHQFFSELRYSHSSGLFASIDVLYVGAFFADNANNTENDAATIANLRIGIEHKFGDWQLAPFFGVNNLFDEAYQSNVRLNGFGGRLFEPGPRAHIFGGVNLRYQRR